MLDPSPRQQAASDVTQLLTDLTQTEPDHVFGVDLTPEDALAGYFSLDDELFEFYVTTEGEFSYVESDDRASQAYLSGLRTQDSQEFRRDRRAQCKTGKPCGDRCIPRGHRCRQGLSKAQQTATEGTRSLIKAQKKSGSWKAGLLVTAGVLGAVGIAGVGAAIVASSSTSSFQRPTPQKPPSSIVPAATPNIQPVHVNPTPNLLLKSQEQKPANTQPAALPPAPDRNQNTTAPIVNPILVTPPTQAALVSDPKTGTPQREASRKNRKTVIQQAVESTSPNPKAKSVEIPANPAKKPTETPSKPVKTDIEQQTERLLRKHKSYEASAQRLSTSAFSPDAIAQSDQKLSQLEVRHRQMMNPLQESYFGTPAKEVRALAKQLSVGNGSELNLQSRLLKGQSIERHRQESDRAIAELDEHSKRVRFAHAALASDVEGSQGRDLNLQSLDRQRSQLEHLKSQAQSVQKAVEASAILQPQISALQQRVSALPTRLAQLDARTQAQHRQVQSIRNLQGKMPGQVTEFARAHSAQLDDLDRQVGAIDQTVTEHDSNRDFAIRSVQDLIQRRRDAIAPDLYLLRQMSGKEGLKWVAEKGVSDVTNGLDLVVRRAQEETGVREIKTLEDAAKFRQHVMGQITKRVEKKLKEIEKRSAYPQEVSDRAVDQVNAQLADLHELQKQAVIEGGETSRSLIKNLQKTAKETVVQLAGTAVVQPYRQAHDFLVQDVQNAQAQKTRAVSETIVTAQDQRDRLRRIAQQPAVFEMRDGVKSSEQLNEEVASVRDEMKRMRSLTTVNLKNVQPTDETRRSMATREQRLAKNDVVKRQISHLQTQLGEVHQQIKKREEAQARGQKKGISTGKLEAQKAAIARQIETLAMHFQGIEKRDRLDASKVYYSGIIKQKLLVSA